MSNLEATLAGLASRIRQHADTIQTEEAIKTSVVLPFLQALGYDVFNPSEVIPEYTSDVVGKRGEKVDYALMRDGEVSILIECKALSTSLNEKHLSQLYRYFSVSNARFAVLTNGREFHFHSDLEDANRLDSRPFFIFDLLDFSQGSILELSKFAKDSFDVANILEQAERLKYAAAIKKVLAEWMKSPPDSLIKLVAGEVYDGRLNSDIRSVLGQGIKSALTELVRDRVRSRLNSALDETPAEVAEVKEPSSDIETTEEEIEGWIMVKSILRGETDVSRVAIRDAKSYCAILLDDNNRKPLARLHFNRPQKYVGLFDGESEERIAIASLDDILDMSARLKATLRKYE